MSDLLQDVASDSDFPTAVDVAVVGGGIIGCSAAYFLAKQGQSVALLEKGRIGGEQSGRNWGWVRQQGRDSAEIPLIKESMALWARLPAQTGRDFGFRRTGIVHVTDDPTTLARWEDWIKQARANDIDTQLLSASEALALRPANGNRWIGGMRTATDGRAEPGLATAAMAESARGVGASIYQGCAVRGLDIEGGRVCGVITERGRVRAQSVICAGGAWSSLLCSRHDVALPQLLLRGSVLRTTPAPEVVNGALATPSFSIRRRLDGGYTVALRNRIRFDITTNAFRYGRAFLPAFIKSWKSLKIRFGADFFKSLSVPRTWSLDAISPFERVRILSPSPDRRTLDIAMTNLRSAFPQLKHVEVAAEWAGMIDATPDALPVISRVPAMPGLVLATGFSGHGFGLGPAAGRLAADLAIDCKPIVDPFAFRYERLIDGTRLEPEVGL